MALFSTGVSGVWHVTGNIHANIVYKRSSQMFAKKNCPLFGDAGNQNLNLEHDGSVDSCVIVNKFANHFSAAYIVNCRNLLIPLNVLFLLDHNRLSTNQS